MLMKITIDTKEDSPDEIRKLIRMLLALAGDSSDYSSQRAPPSSGEGLFDMFGNPEASTSEQQQIGSGAGNPGSGMDVNDFIDKADSEQGNDDDRVVPY